MSIAHEINGEYLQEAPYRYDLDMAQMQELTERLLAEREPRSDDRIVCYRLEQGSPYENVARTIECEVFEKFFGNNAEEMADEYGPYEPQSIFFLSVDQFSKQPAGVLRVIENGPAGLKTLTDLETSEDPAVPHLSPNDVQVHHEIESLDTCWDVGTVAVRKEYRASRAEAQETSVQLYRALYTAALESGVDHFVSIIDARPYDKMTNYLGIPFVPMAGSEPFSYLGSEKIYADYGEVRKFYEKMNRKRKTVRGFMARKALGPLVKGTADQAINL